MGKRIAHTSVEAYVAFLKSGAARTLRDRVFAEIAEHNDTRFIPEGSNSSEPVGLCIAQLSSALGRGWSSVSPRLAELRRAGMIKVVREGPSPTTGKRVEFYGLGDGIPVTEELGKYYYMAGRGRQWDVKGPFETMTIRDLEMNRELNDKTVDAVIRLAIRGGQLRKE